MIRTDAKLADGRDLLYFSESPLPTPPLDERPLEPVSNVGTVRYDALTAEWVAIAGHRQSRTFQPSLAECPLCPSSADSLTEIPASDYEVAVFENRFPSFSQIDGTFELPTPHIGISAPSAGRCEVVCFSSQHDASFRQLSPARARLVIDAWADRTAELSALPTTALVFPFENRGAEIGVTLSHPHGQIYAYPFIPPRAASILRATEEHRRRTGSHLVTDLIDFELEAGQRIIAVGEHWMAFVPYAARWPFQVQLHPRRHVYDLAGLTDEERDELADLYLDVLNRLDRLFDVPMPYISAWYQAPVGPQRDLGRLHLDLFSSRRAPDKLKFLAGSEAAMGAFINDIAPEQAAAMLKEA